MCEGSFTSFLNFVNFGVHKRLKIGHEILPSLRKFCILLQCQASHTKISKRNSKFAKRKEANGAEASRIR